MGAFLLVRRGENGNAAHRLALARRSLERQGFVSARHVRMPSCDLFVYPKLDAPATNLHQADDGTFLAATGTLIYREKSGVTALRLLAADLGADAIDWSALYGHYCILASAGDGVRLFTDSLGVYHVFHDRGLDVISSSFLAVLESLPRATLAPQSVYEYVFQEATYGGATLVDEIALFDCRDEAILGSTCTRRAVRGRPDPALPGVIDRQPPTLDDLLAHNLANLRRSYQAIARAFGDRIDTALSGGYDSRLVLALLREQGVKPRVHVYGRDTDPDVQIAKRIAAGEGFPLVHSDKSRRIEPPTADAVAELVRRNLDAFHGAPADGVFDDGSDLATRRDRCASGELMLNGGGGEIFRNFFYLPDRSFQARDIVFAFYSQFDPRAMRGRYRASDYQAGVEAKLLTTLGRTTRALSRSDVERIYPTFRCRFWMGRNNSINNRLGAALTPFIDPNIVPGALSIPIALKNAGRFEAALIQAVDPRLAAYPSAYGHDFAHPPPFRRLLAERVTMLRPCWVRRHTFRLKWRQPAQRPLMLSDAILGQAIDPAFPVMSAFFDPARIYENGQYNRLCTLELLSKTFGLRVA
ncbi:MAG: hypothetical protein U1E97_01830 [Alphaproteobacteria bacterium]